MDGLARCTACACSMCAERVHKLCAATGRAPPAAAHRRWAQSTATSNLRPSVRARPSEARSSIRFTRQVGCRKRKRQPYVLHAVESRSAPTRVTCGMWCSGGREGLTLQSLCTSLHGLQLYPIRVPYQVPAFRFDENSRKPHLGRFVDPLLYHDQILYVYCTIPDGRNSAG